MTDSPRDRWFTDSTDEHSVYSADRPPSSPDAPRPKVYHPYSPPVLLLLAPGSILGALARLGIVALTTYQGQSIFPLAYVQALGCFIIGICFQLKGPLGDFYGPLYTALSTGFCGSLTTFSGWQYDVFCAWLNPDKFARGGLRSFIDGVGRSAFTLCVSLASAAFGAHLASHLKVFKTTTPFPPFVVRHSLSLLSAAMFIATVPAYIFLPATYRHQATAALMFAYPGTLTRYVLSIQLNLVLKTFPLGTFTANMLGTAISAALHVLQGEHVSPISCSILQGLIDGYCGCLTTVSTFAIETRGMQFRHAVRYAFISWTVAQLVLLVIFGPAFWYRGIYQKVVCSFG